MAGEMVAGLLCLARCHHNTDKQREMNICYRKYGQCQSVSRASLSVTRYWSTKSHKFHIRAHGAQMVEQIEDR